MSYIYNYIPTPEVIEFAGNLEKVAFSLNWSDKKVLAHIDFRSRAQFGCCFEFNENIAKHVGFSEKTVRNSKKRLLKLNLIKKVTIKLGRFKKTAYVLTEIGRILLNFLLKIFNKDYNLKI